MSYAGYVLVIWDDKKRFFEGCFLLRKFYIFFDVLVVLSMLNFTLITVDRLIAVKRPFFYIDRIHTRESFVAIAVAWGFTLVYGVVMVTLLNILLPQKSRLLGSVIFVVVAITGFVTLFISNSFVFVEARRHLRRAEKINSSTENISVEPSDKSNDKKKKYGKKNLD